MPRVLHIGVLYPGYAAEDDYPRLASALQGVDITVAHTTVGEDAHRVDALLDLGGHERLREGAQRLAQADVDVATWACTSGSFVFGWDGARQQLDTIREVLSVPVSSTSMAYVAACHALGAQKVGVAASYPADVTDRFVAFLELAEVELCHVGSHDIITAAEVGTLDRQSVIDLARAGDHPEAEAVLVPDTAMHTIDYLPDLEDALGKPVLTANQVTVWDALRLGGALRAVDGFGTLFRSVPVAQD